MLSIDTYREVGRQYFVSALSYREIARNMDITHPPVSKLINAVKARGLTHKEFMSLDDIELRRIIQKPRKKRFKKIDPTGIDWVSEQDDQGRTKYLIWIDYKEAYGDAAFEYSAFCHHLASRTDEDKLSASFRYPPGQVSQIDFAGTKIPYFDYLGAKVTSQARIFCGALCYSNDFYVEAFPDQTTYSWVKGIENFFINKGGCTRVVICDNDTALVKFKKGKRKLTDNFKGLARHYDTVIMIARPYEPRDKGIVEGIIGFLTSRLLNDMRKMTFIGLDAVNQYLWREVAKIRLEVMKKYGLSRDYRFVNGDKPKLRDLPATRYRIVEQYLERDIPENYRIVIDHHKYSVPHTLRNKRCKIEVTREDITVIHQGKEVCVLKRQYLPGEETIVAEHIHPCHLPVMLRVKRDYLEWAGEFGDATRKIILIQYEHEADDSWLADNRCKAIQRISRTFENSAFEVLCSEALVREFTSPKYIKMLAAKFKADSGTSHKTEAEHTRAFIRGATSFSLKKQENGHD